MVLLKIILIIHNLQILYPFSINGLNLLKPWWLKLIFGRGILIKLKYINWKRNRVLLMHSGVIGPKF